MSATDTRVLRHDGKVLSLIGTGHFLSHFFSLTLPPLFPALKAAFGVSYTELGVMMALMAGTSAVMQVPIGFLVDRVGARAVLAVGLAIVASATGLVGLAGSFTVVFGLMVLAGAGQCVFHPADYAILNASISSRRMGRAFSLHTFAGQLGTAAAPATMVLLADRLGWRHAVLAAGLFGLLVMLALVTQWGTMREDVATKVPKASRTALARTPVGWGLLVSKPMVLFFLFFTMLSMTSTGMQAFAVTALVMGHGMALSAASTALTAYLACSALGVILGGEIADRYGRHGLTAGIVFALTAAFSILLALYDLPYPAVVAIMVVMGLGQGMVRPARDMMLRAVAPKGSAGKVFGFISAGIAAGSALAPIPFGWLLDHGRPESVFYLIAAFMIVSLATVAVPKTTAAPRISPA